MTSSLGPLFGLSQRGEACGSRTPYTGRGLEVASYFFNLAANINRKHFIHCPPLHQEKRIYIIEEKTGELYCIILN